MKAQKSLPFSSMRPRNKKEREVVSLAASLPSITQSQIEWAKNNVQEKIASKSGVESCWCSECGRSFRSSEVSEVICPHCGKVLSVKPTKKRTGDDYDYFMIVTKRGDWQVFRCFLIHKVIKKGEEARFYFYEAAQKWLNVKTRNVVAYELNKQPFSYFMRQPFSLYGPMTIKSGEGITFADMVVYPRAWIHKDFKRYGVKACFHGIRPYDLMCNVTTNPIVETLLKRGDYPLCNKAIKNPMKVRELWGAIKIGFRNGYRYDDVDMYIDYLQAVKDAGRDLLNPKYACPADLEEAHDRMLDIVERVKEKKELMALKKKEEQYIERMGGFFDMELTDGLISLVCLRTIRDFRHEGNILHHCVYKGAYYERKNSLILSARIEGDIIETVEYDLKTKEILQCHGDHNHNSKYHDRIVDLVKKSIPTITKYDKARYAV